MRRSKNKNGGDSEKQRTFFTPPHKKRMAPIFSDDHSNPVLSYF